MNLHIFEYFTNIIDNILKKLNNHKKLFNKCKTKLVQLSHFRIDKSLIDYLILHIYIFHNSIFLKHYQHMDLLHTYMPT